MKMIYLSQPTQSQLFVSEELVTLVCGAQKETIEHQFTRLCPSVHSESGTTHEESDYIYILNIFRHLSLPNDSQIQHLTVCSTATH